MRCHRCGKKGHWRIDCAEELCSRCHGRGHAADICPTSKEEAVLAASDDDDDYDTVEASAFKTGETGECSNVSGRKEEGEAAWQAGDEAWLCDGEASTHMAPSADGMTNYRECNLKLRIANGSTHTIEGYGDIIFVFRSGQWVVLYNQQPALLLLATQLPKPSINPSNGEASRRLHMRSLLSSRSSCSSGPPQH